MQFAENRIAAFSCGQLSLHEERDNRTSPLGSYQGFAAGVTDALSANSARRMTLQTSFESRSTNLKVSV